MTLALEIAFVTLLAVAWPIYNWKLDYPRMLRALERGDDGARARSYRGTLVEQWSLTVAALLLWTHPGRALTALGLGLPHPERFAIGLAIVVGLLVLLAAQRKAVLGRPELLERVRVQLGTAAPLVPHTLAESRLWVALCVTAGLCEEFLFRGFLISWFAAWMPVLLAGVVSSILFGWAHAYLGRTGAIRAGVLGGVMAGIYALTGSLWVPMLLHAAIDLHSGALGYAAMREAPAPAPAQATG